MLSSLVTIALLHWVVLLIPGFNFILIGRLAATGQRGPALAAVAGMTASTLAWALLAVLGVGVVFALHPVLREGVQILGGLYLLQLAFKLWRTHDLPSASSGSEVLSQIGAFRVGFFTSTFNPKIALFYGSVFATALPPSPPLALVAAAVLLVYLNSVVWHLFLTWALSRRSVQKAYLRHCTHFNRVAAGLVGAFGLRLLIATYQELRGHGAA